MTRASVTRKRKVIAKKPARKRPIADDNFIFAGLLAKGLLPYFLDMGYLDSDIRVKPIASLELSEYAVDAVFLQDPGHKGRVAGVFFGKNEADAVRIAMGMRSKMKLDGDWPAPEAKVVIKDLKHVLLWPCPTCNNYIVMPFLNQATALGQKMAMLRKKADGKEAVCVDCVAQDKENAKKI